LPLGSPLGLPFDLANLRKSLETIDKSPLLAFHSLIQKYGPVIRISIGSQVAVLIGGLEEIKEFTALEETTGRPYNKTLLDLYSAGEPNGFGIGIGGPRWKEQRRFASKSLKDLYEGQTGMEEKIHSEVSFTIQHIKNLLLSCEKDYMMMYDADRFLEVPNLNVIWGLVAALRYDFNDPQPKKQFQHLRTFLGEKLAGPLTLYHG